MLPACEHLSLLFCTSFLFCMIRRGCLCMSDEMIIVLHRSHLRTTQLPSMALAPCHTEKYTLPVYYLYTPCIHLSLTSMRSRKKRSMSERSKPPSVFAAFSYCIKPEDALGCIYPSVLTCIRRDSPFHRFFLFDAQNSSLLPGRRIVSVPLL